MYIYACVYVFVHLCVYTRVYVCVCVCIFVHRLWVLVSVLQCGRCHACACVFVCIFMRSHMCVDIYMYIFFAVSVTCTLQALWALVHGRVCMLHRCVFTPTYTSATHSLQIVHICVFVYKCVYACICIWMRMCAYDIA